MKLFSPSVAGLAQVPALVALLCTGLATTAQAQVQIAKGAVEAPYSLTAADGTGLKLVALDARAVVDGPLAFTELHLTFENPQPRVIEGHFKVTMPEGAAISRFAMKIRGRYMEGEVVEKQAARRAYEDALHRKQDPALLEQDSGNTFRARVFPIPARGRKDIIISWSHELTAAGEAYRLPLKGLPSVETLNLTAMTATAQGVGVQSSLGGTTSRYQISKVEKKNFTPDQDFVVFGGDIPKGGDALRTENLAVVRFVVPGGAAAEDLKTAVVMVDTSASRAIGFDARLQRVETLVKGLAEIGIGQVEVIAFDQATESVYTGAPAGFGGKAIKRLKARAALGASSISVALDALEQGKGERRVIFVTDGMLTAGEQDPVKLAKRLATLNRRGVMRADVVVDTTARDGAVLDALVTSQLPRPGKVVEGRAPLKDQLAKLGNKTLGDVKLAVDGAQWIWPRKVRGLQGGDAVVAFVDVPATEKLVVHLSGGLSSSVSPTIRAAEKPLLERAWVNARIQRLMHLESAGDPDLAAGLRHQIIALSTRHRVLSSYTALVVLETERDYRRFNIDRRALADILIVGPTGVELKNRKNAVAAIPPPPPPPRKQPMRTARRNGNRGLGKGAGPGATEGFTGGGDSDGDSLADDMDEAEKVAEAPRDMAPAAEPMPAAAAPPAESRVMAKPKPRAKRKAKKSTRRRPARASGRRAEAPPPPMGGAADQEAAVERKRDSRTRRPNPDPFPARRRPPPPPPRPVQQVARPTGESVGRRELRQIERGRPALTGQMQVIVKDLGRGRTKKALKASWAWRKKDPADLLALIALGQSLAMSGNGLDAARAFGGILDLYPSRADMRRLAGNWLERLGVPGLELAADTYGVAAKQRPDHPSVYHALAMSLVRLGRYEEAMDTVLGGIGARRINNRFSGVERILQEDAQMIGAAWAAAVPAKREAIAAKLSGHNLKIDERSTLRFVLSWETDANDVDFHIFDRKFNHAYYSRRSLASGGELYADITTGYGPECFTIFDPKAYPYKLKAHYYSRGPMGYGAGKIQVTRHDGKGHLGFEDRPFVIMQDGAYVDLGSVKKGAAKVSKKMPAAIAR